MSRSVVCIASMMALTVPPSENDQVMLRVTEEGAVEKLVEFAKNDPATAYNVAKRGVRLLCEYWAPEYGKRGARINSVSPGIIMTEMGKAAEREHPEQIQYMLSVTPLGRYGQAADVAGVVRFLCSPEASFITGTDILVDGGLMMNMLRAHRG